MLNRSKDQGIARIFKKWLLPRHQLTAPRLRITVLGERKKRLRNTELDAHDITSTEKRFGTTKLFLSINLTLIETVRFRHKTRGGKRGRNRNA